MFAVEANDVLAGIVEVACDLVLFGLIQNIDVQTPVCQFDGFPDRHHTVAGHVVDRSVEGGIDRDGGGHDAVFEMLHTGPETP